MLFLLWRNEHSDLLQNYDSYFSHYTAKQAIIDAKCSQYEQRAERDFILGDIAPGNMTTEAVELPLKPFMIPLTWLSLILRTVISYKNEETYVTQIS